LRDYWAHEDRKLPDFDEPTVFWSLKQIRGISDGLRAIHGVTVTYALAPGGAGNVRLPGDAKLSVKEGEQWYGRHGDIKPENILWFKDDGAGEDGNGILKIADFGLGRFHGRDSRSKVDPKTICYTDTYEPPEVRLGTPVSRAYDIWSLACLFLEFTTWLLMGSDAIHEFADFRGAPSPMVDDVSLDSFYKIVKNSDGLPDEAFVADGVTAWVKRLHSHDRCSNFIHDLLRLVMEDMLVVNSTERIRAAKLCERVREFVSKAECDQDYLLAPTPRPTPEDRSIVNSEQAEHGPAAARLSINTSRNQRTVRFADSPSPSAKDLSPGNRSPQPRRTRTQP
jgi:serine/threonine protein kinase